MKEFVTSAKAAGSNIADDVTVLIDEREVTFIGPTQEQMSLLIAATSGSGDDIAGIAEIINIFYVLIKDVEDHRWLHHRLFNRDDEFGVDEVTEILIYLVEEWVGRPTKQPSDYLPSRKSGGRKSTARRPTMASTPST